MRSLEFQIPISSKDFFSFKVESTRLLFAGSRHIEVDPQVCKDLISAFGSLGFTFMTGCAKGVDESFRLALAISEYKDHSIIACAFKKRARQMRGLYPLYVVPQGLPPKVALAKRTLWMTCRCALLILFPSTPIGRGSALAFKSAIMNNKPVFVVSQTRPADSDLYSVYPSNLFGIVDGFWCVPPVYADTGLCVRFVSSKL
jgi:hypothetical protein